MTGLRIMHRTPWFERRFAAIDDNGLLPGILERLEGTAARLRLLLTGFEQGPTVSSGWSVTQEVFHLMVLEPLWLQRAHDIMRGQADLTVADLSNRATHEVNHDQVSVAQLVERFELARHELVATLRRASATDLEHAARHPRLGTPMRLIDLAYFVAEHDDHHLARMRELTTV